MFFDVTNPSEQIVRIDNSKRPLANSVIKELAILGLVLLVFFLPIPGAFLPLAIIPVVVTVAWLPGMGLLAVAIGLMIEAMALVFAQGPRKHEGWETGRGDLHGAVRSALQRINRPSFFVVVAIAISFLPMFAPQEELNARVVEVTRQQPAQIVWQLDISGQESYRTVHLPSLYPEVQW
jgi:Cu/Ag efflux pump CusA